MRKGIYVLALLVFLSFVSNVSAKELYYENNYDVGFTKEEYDFMTFMFWEGSQDLMTSNDYDKLIKSNIMNGTLESKVYEAPLTRATTVEDNNRTLKISKSCSTTCFISVTNIWKNSPTVRSYDVIGAILENTILQNTPSTTVTFTGGTVNSKEIKYFDNGFGVSIKLPTSGNSLVVNQNFRVSSGATVYASYQHAKSEISLANSKNYTLSKAGYGGVFNFSGIASSTYDRMNGVSISL